MLIEAIEKIESLATAANQIQELQETRRKKRYWDRMERALVEVDKEAPARAAKVLTLGSLIDAANRFAADAAVASLWVSSTQVVLIVNDGPGEFRDERVTLPLACSPVFGTLSGLVNAKPLSQKGLLSLLRHDLNSANVSPSNFELAIQSLIWQTSDTEEGNVGTVRSTMGRSVNAEVRGELPIPAAITVTFLPYPALAQEILEPVSVTCSVVTDPEERTLTVRPLPGELEAATNRAVDEVAEWLESRDTLSIDVFCGTP